MKKIDIVGIAFSNFKRRKTRSILTVLGVVIGVASIVIMVSLGIAVNVGMEKQISEMGDLTTITVNKKFNDKTMKEEGELDDALVEQLAAIDKVRIVSPELRVNGKLVAGKFVNQPNIVGVRSQYLAELGLAAESGTFDGMTSTSIKKIPCVMGPEVPYSFYNPKANRGGGGSMMMGGMMMGSGSADGEVKRDPPPVDILSDKTRLRFTFDWSYGEPQNGMDTSTKKTEFYKMEPKAILKQKSGNSDYTVYIDLEVAKKLKKAEADYNKQAGSGGANTVKKGKTVPYDQISVLTDSIDDTMKVTEEIKAMGYNAWSMAEVISSFQKTSQMLQLVLGGIGSISLLVAAIGITNTMIMSIYERTKEIGVMKVIGCQLKDIRTMFLCEAGFIGLFGGAVGLIISYGMSALLNFVGKSGIGAMMGMGGGEGTLLSVIPPWLAIVAVTFAIAVGLISGYFPARRAMKLSALEAMRT